MATFIAGHGVLEAHGPETIVPEGGSITFYTDVDLLIYLTNGMAALQDNDATSGSQTYAAGEPVPNYFLARYTDIQRAAFATVASDAADIAYIGDQVPDNIHLCEATDESMCGGGRHICGGVFGRLDGDLVYLACRGVDGGAEVAQDAYGGTGDTTLTDTLNQLATQIVNMPEDEQGPYVAAMEDARDADQQELLAYLMQYDDVRKAVYKYRTAQYLATAQPAEFVGMFDGQPDQEQGWMLEVPGVQEALDDGRRARLFDE